jgi:hypothetical protein
MGDLIAKVGNNNANLEEIMGRHGLGARNENGELFTEFCSGYRLAIAGTLSPHKDIHKVTWVSPDHKTKNRIDQVTISKKWKKSLELQRS